MTSGAIERPGGLIATRFGGAYVVSDLDHTAFLRVAADAPDLVGVFRDADAVVFQVLTPARP